MTDSEAVLPAWQEEMPGVCPTWWKNLGCLPDIEGECVNCGLVVSKPKEPHR